MKMEDSALADERSESVKRGSEIRICVVCGTRFFSTAQFCVVCMFSGALDEEVESLEFSSEQDFGECTSELEMQRFEHYELVKGEDGKPVELGRGAMGVTYKAYDIDLQCPVALKVISESYLGDESARLRFLREARAAASVRHPNVAWVLHLGRTGKNYFYVMEFVERETLENLIKRSGRLDVKLTLEITTQVAAGLAAVHKQNLVHRDIKPSNIMVSLEVEDTGTVKIIDLGLAKAVDESILKPRFRHLGALQGHQSLPVPSNLREWVWTSVRICTRLA